MGTESVSLNSLLEYVDRLDIEDQQYLQEVIQRRVADKKRSAIARRAKRARTHLGSSREGTAQDLLADLNG